ncbi:TIGR04211 family SH3 domain-containing protein [Colwellia sp. MEBiC06753]
MGKFTQLVAFIALAFSFNSFAQEDTSNYKDGFISDELFIYMHSGAGSNYRIVGSINAGTQVQLTGNAENGYTEIIDDKDRVAWVEDKFVSEKPGLRFVVAELNGQLATTNEREENFKAQIDQTSIQLKNAKEQITKLSNTVAQLEGELKSTQSKLSTQDLDVKKEWFFNGAIVLGIGLLFGLILPRLSLRRKSSMDSWK